MNDERTKLLHILAEIDQISANAQLLLTQEPQQGNSVTRVREMAAEMKGKVQDAIDRLDGLEK